ncbi:MAG: hypothetical protein IT204_26290 [Fimbriimonadaceae bacterium]|nr:hypothetical protein [Fimbriimonadaceae bacterium]
MVEQIAGWAGDTTATSHIAAETLANVRRQLRRMDQDSSVNAAFGFLVSLAVALRDPPSSCLAQFGLPTDEPPTPLSLAYAIRECVAEAGDSPEYANLAQSAAIDAVSAWHRLGEFQQPTLFEVEQDPWRNWQRAGTAAGFCELARLFFARLTGRYLRYFLDREATAALPTLADRQRFDQELQAHVEAVSQHAFETARITQSFAAGWFQSHTREGTPSAEEVAGFLSVAFGKLRDELMREEGTA